MIEFGALPPEINSGRMYHGAGVAPLLVAAAMWTELATELHSAGAGYASAVQTLVSGPWLGPSAVAMAAAAGPYATWLNCTAVQASETAAHAQLAATAYEEAFAATVPPPLVAANRAELLVLVATNLLGQNTAAIAATEAHYLSMWAQDAAAMYAYASASAAANQLTAFTNPPQTTNSGAAAARSAAADSQSASLGNRIGELINSVPTTLQNLARGISGVPHPAAANAASVLNLPDPMNTGVGIALADWNKIFSTISGLHSPIFGWTTIAGGPFLSFGQIFTFTQGVQGFQALSVPGEVFGPAVAAAGELTHLASASTVSGAVGQATLVGSMSVPPAWAQAAPVLKVADLLNSATILPAASAPGEGVAFGQMALSSLAGRALASTATAPAAGGAAVGSLVGAAEATSATIIVIPALET